MLASLQNWRTPCRLLQPFLQWAGPNPRDLTQRGILRSCLSGSRSLLSKAGLHEPHHRAGGLVFDEMKLQEGLVWDQATDSLAGFADESYFSSEASAVRSNSKHPPTRLRMRRLTISCVQCGISFRSLGARTRGSAMVIHRQSTAVPSQRTCCSFSGSPWTKVSATLWRTF